ncbi:hypothetical protein GTA08_BOTSDO01209 [Neofusicoccum parvum]|uniref:Uncharacterized protein n=1 Tax=Neofusicoccum parvum TaxID=310453 RepID=A0ACB5SN16_9PEZI|nr:hypothetical protein GTA08_BOTSDO01209 [Neofusicoccum parvum]
MGAVSSSEYRDLLEHADARKWYDPDAPVVRVRHDAIIVLVCVCNALSLLIMCARIVAQWKRYAKFRRECWWNLLIAVILVFPFWTSQVMMYRYGSGLHMRNVKMEWRIPHWRWTLPWASFYVLEAMVKVSMSITLLQMIPQNYKLFRRAIYAMCFVILGLGFAVVFVWIFQCQPLMSNFSYGVQRSWCADFNAVRYSWVGIAIGIDVALVYIPMKIIRLVRLRGREKKVLHAVFCGNLLGTAATAVAIYGIWESRFPEAEKDLHWYESVLVMYNSVEILLYTFGASLVIFSRYLVVRVSRRRAGSQQDAEAPVTGFHPTEDEKLHKGATSHVWYLRSFDMSRSDPLTRPSLDSIAADSIIPAPAKMHVGHGTDPEMTLVTETQVTRMLSGSTIV